MEAFWKWVFDNNAVISALGTAVAAVVAVIGAIVAVMVGIWTIRNETRSRDMSSIMTIRDAHSKAADDLRTAMNAVREQHPSPPTESQINYLATHFIDTMEFMAFAINH